MVALISGAFIVHPGGDLPDQHEAQAADRRVLDGRRDRRRWLLTRIEGHAVVLKRQNDLILAELELHLYLARRRTMTDDVGGNFFEGKLDVVARTILEVARIEQLPQ